MTPGRQQDLSEKNNIPKDRQLKYLSGLVHLQHRLRQAPTPAELACVVVNDTVNLLPYHQAVFWETDGRNRIRIRHTSGTDQVTGNAPYILFLEGLIRSLGPLSKSRTLSAEEGDEAMAEEWKTWLPDTIRICPLNRRNGRAIGGLIFIRPLPWTRAEISLLDQVSQTFAYGMEAFEGRSPLWPARITTALLRPWRQVLALLILLGMFIPVRLSVLAPMEIIPRDPVVVAAPMDGAIKDFMVSPNQTVTAGTPLFSLDDIRIRNEHDIAVRTLDVALADELRARQKAFSDQASRAELLLLKARVRQQQAAADYLAEQLERSMVRAPVQGVAVFNDVNDWLGRPVVVGEKILTLADPQKVMARISLPVADAITLAPGARIRIFLNIAPDTPLEARLGQASYEAGLTPDHILAFSLKADLADASSSPRIGLRGTAKLYGDKVRLHYFLFRRPLAFLRQLLGV